MRRWLLLLPVLMLLSACDEKDVAGKVGKSSAVDTSRLSLTKVIVEPENPSVDTSIRALSRLSSEPRETVSLIYQWFVNGERIPAIEKAVLPSDRYKRGDKVYCRARIRSGERWVKSQTVEIVNAPPRFRAKPVAPFDIPGEFFHQVFADDADGDSVTYRLVSPLARGVELDPRTGIIRWRIENVPEAPLPPARSATPAREGTGTAAALPRNPAETPEKEDPFTLRLLIEADDGHGGIARHMVVLDLRRGMEQVQVD